MTSEEEERPRLVTGGTGVNGLSGQPLFNGHFSKSQGWPLNRGRIVVGRVACFPSLVGFSPTGVFQILHSAFCIFIKTDFNLMFFHDIYFCNVVPKDFVRGVLQPSFQHVEENRLQALIQVLPAVLLKSKSVNTTKKYERGFHTWRKWVRSLTASVSLFILNSIQESVSCSIIDEVHYGLKSAFL